MLKRILSFGLALGTTGVLAKALATLSGRRRKPKTEETPPVDERDPVDEASYESFPASDPPASTPTTASPIGKRRR